MDVARLSVLLGALGAVAAFAVLLFVSSDQQGGAASSAVLDRSGQPMAVPTSVGWTSGTWEGEPVIVFAQPQSILAGVDAVRGPGAETPSIASPDQPGLRIFAFSAWSTHLGCTVGFNAGLGASLDVPDYNLDGVNDGRIMDPCSQVTWDAFHRAAPSTRFLHYDRLAALDLVIKGNQLEGTGYDGPIGPPSHRLA